MKLSQYEQTGPSRVLVVGLPGSGKSTLVSKLAEAGYKLWWFSLDNDAEVLYKLPEDVKETIEFFNIPDSADFPIGAQTLLQVFKEKKGTICHKHGKFKCALCKDPKQTSAFDFTILGPKDIVVLDTVTQLGHSILAYCTKDKPVDYKPERDDWGGLRKYTEFFCSQFQAAQYNLAVIAHVIEAEMEDGRTKLVPNFGSKGMSAEFAKAFSHVVYCEVVNKKHKAFSASTATNNVLTKSRTDFRIEDLAEPSLAGIFKREPVDTPVIESIVAQAKQEVKQDPKPDADRVKTLLAQMKK